MLSGNILFYLHEVKELEPDPPPPLPPLENPPPPVFDPNPPGDEVKPEPNVDPPKKSNFITFFCIDNYFNKSYLVVVVVELKLQKSLIQSFVPYFQTKAHLQLQNLQTFLLQKMQYLSQRLIRLQKSDQIQMLKWLLNQMMLVNLQMLVVIQKPGESQRQEGLQIRQVYFEWTQVQIL